LPFRGVESHIVFTLLGRTRIFWAKLMHIPSVS
jgi:hypothetical protein